jgi:hypothetical protein
MNEPNKKGNAIGHISVVKANMYALIFAIPAFLISIFPYYLIWHNYEIENTDNLFTAIMLLVIYFVSLLVLIVVHELIHGIFFAKYSQSGWKAVKFGIMWKMFTPYCHGKEPITMNQYRIALLMPTVVVGLLPVIISFFIDSTTLNFIGFTLLLGGAGDVTVVWLTRKVKGSTVVLDSETQVGCEIIDDENKEP